MDILYRYRKGTQDDIDILTSNKLWVGNSSNFNDPFDCAARFCLDGIATYVSIGHIAKKLSIDRNRIDKAVIEKIVKLSMQRTKGKSQDDALAALEMQNQVLRDSIEFKAIACFIPNNKSVTMWSHYADYHKGFCIAYEKSKLEEIGQLKQVKYKNDFDEFYKIMHLETQDTSSYYHELLNDLLTTKSKEWEQENEWRLICDTQQPMPDNSYGFSLDSPKPVAIYLGCKAETNEINIKQQILNYSFKKSIPFYQMKTVDGSFMLDDTDRVC